MGLVPCVICLILVPLVPMSWENLQYDETRHYYLHWALCRILILVLRRWNMNKHVLDFLDDSLSGFIDSLQAERCHCWTFCRGLSNIWERRRPDCKLAPSDGDIGSYGSNSEVMSFDRCGGRKVSILVFGPSHTISQLNFSFHKGWVGGPSAFCKRFPRLVHMVPQPIPKGNQDFAERCEILDKSRCMLHKIPTLRQINIVLSAYNCAVQIKKIHLIQMATQTAHWKRRCTNLVQG